MTAPSGPQATLAALRRLLLGLLAFGLCGTTADLLLLAHYEDVWQVLPLGLLALAGVASAGLAMALRRGGPSPAIVRLFQASMCLLIACGLAGTVLHYRANMEFKLEMDESLSGLPLFWSVVRAKAPPALAPATLVLLGLLGLTGAFRLAPRPDIDHP